MEASSTVEMSADQAITLDISSEQTVTVEESSSEITFELGSESVEEVTMIQSESESTVVLQSDDVDIGAEVAITLVGDRAEAVTEDTVEFTTETVVMSSTVETEERDSEEESDSEEEESGSEEEESDAEETTLVIRDESEIGHGDAEPTSETITMVSEDGTTETVTTSVSGGQSHVEVRTMTKTHVVEVVEVEEGDGDFHTPNVEVPLRGCVVKEGETARMECKINCEGDLEVYWWVLF